MRRLLCTAVLALAAACEAPTSDDPTAAADGMESDPGAFRAEPGGEPPAYAGEWALAADNCRDARQVWTVEEHRMGIRRKRFCVFERVLNSSNEQGQGWSASARCLADGRESQDFVFFRVTPTRQQMRVTINDSESVELVRCPMST